MSSLLLMCQVYFACCPQTTQLIPHPSLCAPPLASLLRHSYRCSHSSFCSPSHSFFQAVSPFIDPITKKKIAFVDKGPKEVSGGLGGHYFLDRGGGCGVCFQVGRGAGVLVWL